MKSRSMSFASLLAAAMLATAPAFADDPVKDIVDQQVPALKDGSRIAYREIEKAILDACARRKFKATVVEPGLITAHWESRGHSFDVTIPFNDKAYSIRYKDSVRMDYNPDRHRIDDAYNEYVDGLSDHIDAHLDEALDRLKKEHRIRKVARVNPRYAV